LSVEKGGKVAIEVKTQALKGSELIEKAATDDKDLFFGHDGMG
jgi:hypothetical protein